LDTCVGESVAEESKLGFSSAWSEDWLEELELEVREEY
jgi:hypothetical protein